MSNNEFLSFNNIPKFHGLEENQNPMDWIDHLTLLFEENNLEKEKWLGRALLNVSSKIAADFTSFKNINPIKNNESKWNYFIKFLQSNYGHISSVDDAMEKLKTIKLENDIYLFNNSFRRLIAQVGWQPDSPATISFYRCTLPNHISKELIVMKPETLSIAMAIAQNTFKAYNIGRINNQNLDNNSGSYTDRDDSHMDIDKLNISPSRHQQLNNRNNYQKTFRNNNSYRHRNNDNNRRLRYEWFKDVITKDQYYDRLKKGLCVLCSSWVHTTYNCPEVKDSKKA
jgi:Ty3 transposon capsid-like protein